MIPIIGLSLIFSVLLCVHVVRSGRELYWLWIILLFQPIGGIVYGVAILLPELLGGPTARRLGESARRSLDPTRAYREAGAAVEDSPTVHNRMRLAAAAADLDRWEEAEKLYREAAYGVHQDDPALLLGRASALVELERYAEALPLLERLGDLGEQGRTPQAALAIGRVYDGLGRIDEADSAYQWAASRLPGLEALARYAAFLSRTGRRNEAEEILVEIDGRLRRANSYFRKEGQAWRDLAAQALG